MPKKKFHAVAKGHKTGIFDTWAECQKATRGFKKTDFRSFEIKKQPKKWLDENLESSNNEVAEVNKPEVSKPGLGGKIKHCLERCKFNGEDESKGDMIECSLKNGFI